MRLHITIRKLEAPLKRSFDQEFEFLARSLGIDTDSVAGQVFKEILLASEKSGGPEGLSVTATVTHRSPPVVMGISSAQLVERVGMSRGSIVNHLQNLQASGLIEKEGRNYRLRAQSMYRLMEELRQDVERVFAQLERTALDLDREMERFVPESDERLLPAPSQSHKRKVRVEP